MQCPKCNTQLPDDARFCFTCGLPTENFTAEPYYPDEELELAVGQAEESEEDSEAAESSGRSKTIFFLVVAVLAVVAIVLGIGIGKLLAKPFTQDSEPAAAASENTQPGSTQDELVIIDTTPDPTPVPTHVPTPEPTPEPTPVVVTPSPVYADAATLLSQFKEIRGIIRSQSVSYVDGPVIRIPANMRNECYDRLVNAIGALSYVSSCSAETQELIVNTTSGLTVTLGTDGHISLINCPELLAGNAVNEYLSISSILTGSDISSDADFAAAVDSFLGGDIGLYSYAEPDRALSLPLGEADALGSLCYFTVGSTGNLYSGSGNVIYASAVYNALWGEAPLSLDEADYSHSYVAVHQSGKVTGQQMYIAFTTHSVLPGALLVGAPKYASGDTFLSAAILLNYDDSSVDVLYLKDGSVVIQRTDWANFSYIFGPESYLQTVYQPDDDYVKTIFPKLKAPKYTENAGALNPDPDTLDAPTLSVYGESVPYSLTTGGSFGIYGNVTTDVGEITSVTVSITDSYGNVWQTSTVKPEAGCQLFNLYSNFNIAIRFGGLDQGTYRYTVSVTARSGSIELTDSVINSIFYVSD